MHAFVFKTYAPETTARYNRIWGNWWEYCEKQQREWEIDIDPSCPPIEILGQFLIDQVTEHGVRASTAKAKLAAIRAHLRVNVDASLEGDALLRAVGRAVQKAAPPVPRLLIRIDQLRIIQDREMAPTNALKSWLGRFLITVGFWFALRPSEAARLLPEHIERRTTEVAEGCGKGVVTMFTLTITKHKTGPQNRPQHVSRKKHDIPKRDLRTILAYAHLDNMAPDQFNMCSNMWEIESEIAKHARARVTSDEPTIWWKGSLPSERHVVQHIKRNLAPGKSAKEACIDAHSLRHGGSNYALHVQGKTPHEVKLLGRWKSDEMIALYTHS